MIPSWIAANKRSNVSYENLTNNTCIGVERPKDEPTEHRAEDAKASTLIEPRSGAQNRWAWRASVWAIADDLPRAELIA